MQGPVSDQHFLSYYTESISLLFARCKDKDEKMMKITLLRDQSLHR